MSDKIKNVLMLFSLIFSWLVGFLFVIYCAVVSMIEYPFSANNITWIILALFVIVGMVFNVKNFNDFNKLKEM